MWAVRQPARLQHHSFLSYTRIVFRKFNNINILHAQTNVLMEMVTQNCTRNKNPHVYHISVLILPAEFFTNTKFQPFIIFILYSFLKNITSFRFYSKSLNKLYSLYNRCENIFDVDLNLHLDLLFVNISNMEAEQYTGKWNCIMSETSLRARHAVIRQATLRPEKNKSPMRSATSRNENFALQLM
jgi:hypothetical protein